MQLDSEGHKLGEQPRQLVVLRFIALQFDL